MSSDAVGWTIRHSPFRGSTLLVHLMLADVANDQNDNELWMALGNLAKKARCSRSTASEAVGKLTVGGFLECLNPDAATGAPIPYRFLFPDVAVVFETRRKPKAGKGGGVRKADTPPVTAEPAPGVGFGDGGCPESGRPVSENPTPTQVTGTERQEEPPPAANGGEEDLATRSRALVKDHWDRCKATGQPTPTLRAVKGSPFLALAGIVAHLLDAGYAPDDVADALVHTQTFTTNGLTFTLRQRAHRDRPATGPRATPPRDGWGESGAVNL